MKKIILLVTILLMVVLTGCDNNKGPFEVRRENGKRVLYSGNKPASGAVQTTKTLKNGDTVVIDKIVYKDGMPSGKTEIYDYSGEPKYIFDGNIDYDINPSVFEGEVKIFLGDEEAIMKGKFVGIDNFLYNNEGFLSEDIFNMSMSYLIQCFKDGEITTKNSKEKIIIKNGEKVE